MSSAVRVLIESRTWREISGVMPEGFAFPANADAWTNLAVGGVIRPQQRRFLYYHAIGRIAPGVTIDDVPSRVRRTGVATGVEMPESNSGWTARVVPLAGADAVGTRPALFALLAAVGGVLLIGCANVANILLARASTRRREIAVRVALGAGTLRLARQSLTEALVIAAAGTAAGMLLGPGCPRILVRLAPPDVPRLAEVRFNGPLILFSLAAGVVSAAFIGIAARDAGGPGRAHRRAAS
jgi:hypothetical protein